ncbi:amidohydrolase [Agromyces rhizosphaerae]|uniref:Amidohydrolase n=1 Tax=Agromyces rhizosphaerae TaxID=88374 RepID=A0A9W6CVX2_9MICO|nr:amidohydrolase family protein [Agromyces rhizosphaerae]GLI27769.1 amidohydrolase [Agromyces rhizosphaerae]
MSAASAPGTELIDAHVHVWDPALHRYEWLDGLEIHRPMLPAAVDRADGATTGMVFVQAGADRADALAEARWVAAADWPELVAIVADADLLTDAGELAEHLDALAALPKVVGVRDNLQNEPVETFPARAAGLVALGDRGLTFDACIRHTQLPALIDLVAQAPDVTVVLDHLGKPPIDAGIDSPEGRAWSAGIGELASRPGTFAKLSGLTAESADADAFARNADAFIARVLEAFGPERTMLGSDWPVSATFGVGGPFADWVARVRALVGEADWPEVASGSARRAYLGHA